MAAATEHHIRPISRSDLAQRPLWKLMTLQMQRSAFTLQGGPNPRSLWAGGHEDKAAKRGRRTCWPCQISSYSESLPSEISSIVLDTTGATTRMSVMTPVPP